jgi:hypothetical protein
MSWVAGGEDCVAITTLGSLKDLYVSTLKSKSYVSLNAIHANDELELADAV